MGRTALSGFTNVDWGAPGRALVDGVKNYWNQNIGGKGINVLGANLTIPFIEGGGIIPATSGGQLVMAAEGGEAEAFFPESMWGGISPSLLASVPKFQYGGVIGSVRTGGVTTYNQGGQGNITFNVTVSGVASRGDARAIGKEIGDAATSRMRRAGYMRG